MRFVEIEVECLARTHIDREAVRRWLDRMGAVECPIDAIDAITDGEQLIGLAGKRCYKSFQPKLNPNVTKIRKEWASYFENILKSGHGCYDDETEVLTADGWKPWAEVTPEDRFATRTTAGDIQYHKPIKLLLNQPYRGRMYRVDSEQVDLLVTPNHNMYVCKTTARSGRARADESYDHVKAEDLGQVSHAYVKSGRWGLVASASAVPVDVMSLLGFTIGDGHLKSAGTIDFHLRRDRKIAYLHGLVTRLGWSLAIREDHYTVALPDRWWSLFAQIYDDNNAKVIPQHLLISQVRPSLAGLFEGLLQSDGHDGATSLSFDSTSQTLIGQVQQLCLHIGLSANILYTYGLEDRPTSYGEKPLTRLGIIRRCNKPEVNKWAGHRGRTSWVEDWEGLVHCATVPNHTLYVRRDGKPVWCGNSVLEHANFTFAFENVSRVFTAEMNRHRAGVAISEQSLRYVRFEDIPFWLPNSIRANDSDLPELRDKKHATRNTIAALLKQVEAAYVELVRLWDFDNMKDFHTKKQVTSLLRRIIPLGVATGGVWTMNGRAIRHICTMRCDPAAEEEILYVFSRVAKHMCSQAPLLFQDFKLTADGFWCPEYCKV